MISAVLEIVPLLESRDQWIRSEVDNNDDLRTLEPTWQHHFNIEKKQARFVHKIPSSIYFDIDYRKGP